MSGSCYARSPTPYPLLIQTTLHVTLLLTPPTFTPTLNPYAAQPQTKEGPKPHIPTLSRVYPSSTCLRNPNLKDSTATPTRLKLLKLHYQKKPQTSNPKPQTPNPNRCNPPPPPPHLSQLTHWSLLNATYTVSLATLPSKSTYKTN